MTDTAPHQAPAERRALAYVKTHAMHGDPQSVLDTLDAFSRHHAFLLNVGHQKGLILDRAIQATQAKRVLELGCFSDNSAIRIARLLPQDGKLICVDTHSKQIETAREMVAFAGLSDKVEWIEGAAATVLPAFQGAFDVVFINHAEEHYLPDLALIEAKHLITRGSIVVADHLGYLKDSLELYLSHVRNSGHYASTFYETKLPQREAQDNGVEVSRRL